MPRRAATPGLNDSRITSARPTSARANSPSPGSSQTTDSLPPFSSSYHSFSSKDEVLETIFRENWGVLVERINAVEESGESARDQLRHVAAIVLRTWRHQPDVVRVLVREIARSPEVQERISDLVKPIEAIRRIIERGRASREFRADLDAAIAAVVFTGGFAE